MSDPLAICHCEHKQDYITTDAYPQCLDCSTEEVVVDWYYLDDCPKCDGTGRPKVVR